MRNLHTVFQHLSINGRAILLTICLTFTAIFSGFLAAAFPPALILAITGAPLAVLLSIGFPTVSIAAVLAIAFGLVPNFILPSLPIAGARIQPAEVLLILTFLAVAVQSVGKWKQIFELARPVALPFFVLCCAVLIGFFQGKFVSAFPYAGADLRHYFGWLAFPIAIWLLQKNSSTLNQVLLAIAIVASVGMIFQLGTGIQVIYGFRGAEELSKDFSDIVRSAIGGGVVVVSYAAYYFFYKFCNEKNSRLAYASMLLIAVGGIVGCFSRGVWVGFAVGGLVLLISTPKLKHGKLLQVLTIGSLGLLAFSAVLVAKPRLADAILERFTSVSQEGKRGSSMGFRFDENQQAWSTIKRAPVLGSGLGVEYKTSFRQAQIGGGFDIESSFIHNGYLGLWMKLGVLGPLFPLLLLFALVRKQKLFNAFLKRTGEHQRCGDPARSYAAMSAFFMMSVYAITSPEWSTFSSLLAASSLLAVFLHSTHQPTADAIFRRNV